MPAAHSLEPIGELDFSSAAPLAAELDLGGLIATQYHELRLAPLAAQVDYLAAFTRENAAALHERVARILVDQPAYDAPGWRAIERLLADWQLGTSLAAQRTSMLWFELDDFQNQPRGAVPSLSVCLLPRYRIEETHGSRSAEDLFHACQSLNVMGAAPTERDALPLVFDALPAGGRWIHLSYMLGRARHAIKLYGAMPRRELLPYLQRVGWAGDRAAIGAALEGLYPAHLLGDELYLDLNLDDFRDQRRCTLGLAVAQQHLLRGANADPCRAALLEVWRKAELVDAAKVQAVQAWPRSAGTRRNPFEREIRYLDVKLVWTAGAGWRAKAYLGRHTRIGAF